MSVRVFAPAKINITLEVARARADGLHPLQSAVTFADVGDWIEALPAQTLSLRIEGPFAASLAPSDDNLVLRAARLLDAKRGAALRLIKNLPVAAGVGGGSSDAAATLKALNELWALGFSEGDLEHRAIALGADVCACVQARARWMSGVGEHLAPLTSPALNAVLVNPGAPLATGAVYQAFDAAGLGGAFKPSKAPIWRSFEQVTHEAAVRGNDLTKPASQILPVIDEVLGLLRADIAVHHAELSGSGATCFALVRTKDDAISLAARLRTRKPDWWIEPTLLSAA
jgi:4-diphosphocytidyl-2-C-methyl-D-erythritol kinase